MASDMSQLETLFLALGDRTRLRLLSLMAAGPVPVGLLVDLTGESQPKVSRHLAYLRNCGIARTERKGKQVFYGIDLSGDTPASHMLAAVISSLTHKPGERTEPAARASQPRLPKAPRSPDIYVETNTSYDEPLTRVEEVFDEETTARNDREELDVFLL